MCSSDENIIAKILCARSAPQSMPGTLAACRPLDEGLFQADPTDVFCST